MSQYINTLSDIFSVNESENDETQEMPVNKIIDKIISSLNGEGVTLNTDGKTLSVKVKSGYTFVLDEDTLKYYQQIFDENIQKEQTFDKYIPEIDNMLNLNQVTDVTQKINRIKVMKSELGIAEQNSDKFSIIYRIINSDAECDTKIRLFNAYANNTLSGLSDDEINTLNTYLNDYLMYYKFLFDVFNIFG